MGVARMRVSIAKTPNLDAKIGKWGHDKALTTELLAKIGFEVESEVKDKDRVPVDSGRLRASMGTSWAGHPAVVEEPATQADAVSMPGSLMAVHVGSGVNYAKAVHENHRSKSHFLRNALVVVRAKSASIGKRFN